MKANLGKTLTVILAFLFSSFASAAIINLDNWGFDPDGTGATYSMFTVDEMTFNGMSYTNTDPTVAGGATTVDTGDTFTDVGRLSSTGFQNDGSVMYSGTEGHGFNYIVTATFTDWTGTYTDGGTGYVFDAGGTFNMYVDYSFGDLGVDDPLDGSFENYDDGTMIMTAAIAEGSGSIDFSNPSGIDGTVDILFQITSAADGYFFYDTNNDGIPDTDLASLLCDILDPDCEPTYLGLTDSNNAITTNVTSAQMAEFLLASGDTDTPNPLEGDIVTLNDGSYSPGIAVPEPEAISLMALAFLGLAGFQHRRKKA